LINCHAIYRLERLKIKAYGFSQNKNKLSESALAKAFWMIDK